ncbi:unnamed protein product [Didymodactylos carnosus]|uniref:Uncharacterized protein n=1 Tax=Didymodactylos carnosus TaxID=1234261 RepID=A0A8S2FFA0_9BILA|nr:unnamed protein product [Didymodactylos carnosus]CAF4241267.1 unnamed protein product [Didymodactylos carnosus]
MQIRLSVFRKGTDLQQMASDLNNDLVMIDKWSQHWKLSLNILKCGTMLFTVKPVPAVLPRLYIANNPVRQTTVHKHLGLLLTVRLDWTTHIDNILLRINKLIGLLKLHSRVVNRQALDSAQYRAALAVTGAMCGSSSESILSDLGWSCIRDIFKQRN